MCSQHVFQHNRIKSRFELAATHGSQVEIVNMSNKPFFGKVCEKVVIAINKMAIRNIDFIVILFMTLVLVKIY